MSASPGNPNAKASEAEMYKQVGENYRFFAKWRQLAFAGHLAVLAAAMSFTGATMQQEGSRWLLGACFFLVSVFGIIFFITDRRTHQVTEYAIMAGKKLEGTKGGFFTETEKQDRKKGLIIAEVSSRLFKSDGASLIERARQYLFTHSAAAVLLFLGSSAAFFVAAIVTFAGYFPSQGGSTSRWEYKIISGPINDVAIPTVTLAAHLDQASSNGWEFVSSGIDPTNGAYMLLRRPRK